MPMVNIAVIIRLDPERIIVAPMRIPDRSNFVVSRPAIWWRGGGVCGPKERPKSWSRSFPGRG